MARRRSLCIGVTTFASGSWEPLPEASRQAAALNTVLTEFGFEAAATSEAPPISEAAPLGEAAAPSADPAGFYRVIADLGAEDLLVVAVVGHGTVVGGELYVVGPDGRINRHTRVGDWIKEIQDMPNGPRTLFLLDLCQAGVVARSWYPPADHEGAQKTWVIAACPPWGAAYDGRFTEAVTSVLGGIAAGVRQIHSPLEFVPLTTLARSVRRELARMVTEQDAYPQEVIGGLVDLADADADDAPPFFRNPAFLTDPVQEVRQDVDDTVGAFVDELDAVFDPVHYVTRAGGHPDSLDMGCFTGRRRELDLLARWMDGEGDGTLRIVTGCPGVGKSALLGVLVCAAHPSLRRRTKRLWFRTAQQPPAENPALAVAHARQRGNTEIMDSLARQLGLPQITEQVTELVTQQITEWAALRRAIQTAETPPLLIVDAVDEALQPGPLADELLALTRARRTDGHPTCRLLVGMRPRRDLPAFVALRAAAEREGGLVDLDDRPREEVRQDIETYVTALLTLSTPYDTRPYATTVSAFATAVADVLATAVRPGTTPEDRWGEFLVAALYTHGILGRRYPVEDPAEATALGASVPRRLPDVLELDLADAPDLRAVLTAVAYARGEGISQEVIEILLPLFATAATTDVRRALEAGRFYLRQTADEDGTVLYRLFHQGLADHLRADGRDGDVLDRLRPGKRRWGGSVQYALKYAIQHAADAGRADELLADPDFLAHADAVTLQPLLRKARTDAARLAVAVYRSSAGRHQSFGPMGRRQVLGLDATRYGATGLAREWTKGLPWWPRWATGSQVAAAFQSTVHTAGLRVNDMDTAELDGRLVAVVAPVGQPPGLWDLVSGAMIGSRFGTEEAVACAFSQGRVVTGHRRGVIRVWDPWTGHPVGVVLTWDDHELTGLVCGESIVVAASSVGTARAWDLDTLRPRGTTLVCGGTVDSLTCLRDDRGLLVAAGVDAQRVVIWDLETGREEARYEADGRSPEGISVGHLSGSVIVYGCQSGVWLVEYQAVKDQGRFFPRVARDLLRWWEGPAITGPLVLSTVGDQIVVGCADGLVHLIGAHSRTAARSAPPPLAHGSPVAAVASAHTSRGAVAVSAGGDGGLRVWDLTRSTPLGSPQRGHMAQISALALAEVGGRELLFASDQAPAILAWEPGTGDRLRPLEGEGAAGPLAIWRAPHGALMAVAGGGLAVRPRAGVRMWDLATLRGVPGEMHVASSWHVAALTAVRRGATELLVAGGFDGALEVWTPDEDGVPRLTDRLSGDGYVHPVAFVPCPGVSDHPVLASLSTDGIARVWDLEALPRGGVPIGPRGGVSAVACTLVRHRSVVVTGLKDGTIRTWDLRTGEESGPELRGHSDEVLAIACGPSIAVTSGRDATLRIWDLDLRRLLHTIAIPEPAQALLMTRDGDIVAAMNWELMVWSPRVVSTQTGARQTG